MSGINRFLSRRDKHHRWSHNKDSNLPEVQQEKVMLPKKPSSIPIPSSSSASSSRAVSGTSTPLPYSTASTSAFSSSSSSSSPFSLSLAFSISKIKRSPRLQATEILVQSSTANTADHCVLQPRATSGHLHGLFNDFEETTPEKDAEQKVHGQIWSLEF